MANFSGGWFNNLHGSWNWNTGLGVTWRPAARVSARAGIEYSRNHNETQWVTNLIEPGAPSHYVFGVLDQRTVSLSARVNYTITPRLTVQIYARPFEGSGQPVRISSDGGSEPRWRGDGREIYYLSTDGVLMAAPVERAGAAIRPGVPAPLFRAPAALDFEVAPAGDRFLIRTATGQDRPPIRLLTDWRAAIAGR